MLWWQAGRTSSGTGQAGSKENKQRAGQAGSKENKQRAEQAGSKENKQRAGQAGSKENRQPAGQAGGVVASREGKKRAGQAGSKENKQRAGQVGSKEDKQRAGQAGSKEDKQRAGQASPKEDKQRAGQAGAKWDKQRAGQARAVQRALNYAREILASQSTQAFQHIWERGDEIEPSGSVADEEEEAMLQSVASPSLDEFTGSKVGTSLASTVRGFWEQTGMDRFPLHPAANAGSCTSLEALVRAILDEKVDTADMVALAKEWHKKGGIMRGYSFSRLLCSERFPTSEGHGGIQVGPFKVGHRTR